MNTASILDTSLSDTYYLAARARSKLTKEASRHDHNLRVLVSHANLLDSVMDSLHYKKLEKQRKIELEKQRNFVQAQAEVDNKKVTFELPAKPAAAHVIYEEEEDDDDFSDSDSDYSDIEDEQDQHYSRTNHRDMPTIEEDYEYNDLVVSEEPQTTKVVTVVDPMLVKPVAVRPPSPPAMEDEKEDEYIPQLSYSSDEEEEEEEEYRGGLEHQMVLPQAIAV